MPAIKGNPLSPTLGSLGDRWGYVMWSVMLNIYIFMTSEDERTKNEYAYFYDEIVKDDLLKRQKNFSTHSGPFVWTVAWSRENERFEYVAENGRTFGFGIDDPPPTPEDLDCIMQLRPPIGWSPSDIADPVVVVNGLPVTSEEASAPTLKAILS